MLGQMRKGAQHTVVKMLFFLLAVSFVVWGIGDVFRGSSGGAYVATVGSSGVTPAELENAVREEVSRYQEMTGQRLSEEEIKKLGLNKYALEQLIRNKTITLRATDLHLVAGKKIIAASIYNNEAFFSDQKVFDKDRFQSLLHANGFTEERFVNTIKKDYAIRTLMENISMVSVVPKAISSEIFKFRSETRIADLVILSADTIKEVGEPSETDLVQFYKDNQNSFATPEQRAITYITFNADKIKNSIKISPEELQTEYQNLISQYSIEEARDVSQYLFATEEEALAAHDAISKNDIKNYSKNKINLGKVTKSGLPDEVKETVFTLKVSETSKPVNSPMGWHIFVVNSIEAAKTKTFDEVKKNIEKDLLEKKISDEFARFGNEIEDEFAAGKSMEDTAKKFDLKVHKIPAIDANNKNNDGKTTDLPDSKTLIPMVFSMDIGTPSTLTLLSDNTSYAIVQVDSVAPQRIKALDEAKGDAVSLWKNQNKIKLLQEKAEEVSKKLNAGEDLKSIVSKMNLKSKLAQVIKRPSTQNAIGEEDGTPAMLARELFNLKKAGNATGAYHANDGSFMVAVLTKINKTTPADDKTAYRNMQSQLENDIRDDIVEQYLNHLQKEYTVSIKTTENTGK